MTTKTEAASNVRLVLQAIKDRVAKPNGKSLNEATTRAHFLNPLLNALGYSGIDDLEFEHYLPDGKTFLDYRLHVQGSARVAVEAKALSVDLTEQHAAQGVSYAAVLGDEWLVLTNARQWRLYHTFAQTALAGKLVMSLDLVGWQTDAEFERLFDQLWLVSKDAFLDSDGPQAWLTGRKLDSHLQHVLTDSGSAEVKYLRKQLENQNIGVSAVDVATWFKRHLEPAASTGKSTYSVAIPTSHSKVAEPPPPLGALKQNVSGPTCWIVPSGKQAGYSAADHLHAWLSRGFWGFGVSTPGRKSMKPGDWACFYAASSHQVLAVGRIAGDLDHQVTPDEWPGPGPYDASVYKVPLADITWLDPPPIVDAAMRSGMDAFQGKDPGAGWAWLVQTTRRVSAADYKRLTGKNPG